MVLQTPDDQAITGATVVVRPDPVNPTTAGTVLSTVTGITDNNGALTLDLIPSTANAHYILTVNKGTIRDLINPVRFQMPQQDTTLRDLLQARLADRADTTTGGTGAGLTAEDQQKLDDLDPRRLLPDGGMTNYVLTKRTGIDYDADGKLHPVVSGHKDLKDPKVTKVMTAVMDVMVNKVNVSPRPKRR